MKVVGITGPTGAGKTTALRAVEKLGGRVFDCDAVYRELLASNGEMLRAIEGRFPGAVRDGALNRAALARQVFADPDALADLSALTHPYVLREVERRLRLAEAEGCPLAAVDAIGLFESGLAALCDATVLVTAPAGRRVRRIMERDGLSREAAEARAGAQRDDGYFRALCDHELVNNYPDSGSFLLCCEDFFRRFL